MKLSEKGLKRLIHNCVSVTPSPYSCGDGDDEPSYHLIVKKQWYHNRSQCSIKKFDFKPDDFQGVVCLTVEEAEKLMKLLDLCEYWLMKNSVSYDCDAWASLLEERIEQAEMSMQSTQCENVSKKDEKIITLSAEQAEDKE